MAPSQLPDALVFYHYFHPDDVVSAQHFADLCTGLQNRGWDVTVAPSTRSCRDESQNFPTKEEWQGVHVRRIWRPPFRQASGIGRILNAAWMITAWGLLAFFSYPKVLIIGTDPIFSILVAIPWRLLRPKTKIFHWCFDMHPEAAIAEGMVSKNHWSVRLLRPLLTKAYRSCHLHGSLGPCMDTRIKAYDPKAYIRLITPWALAEPVTPLAVDQEERALAFGQAKLAVMYSGNFGKAHEADFFLQLARRLRHEPEIKFVFSVRGNRADELIRAVTEDDTNISFIEFAPQNKLEQRLSSADIHMVSLRPGYEGTVVPSKFQGALAAGRPILYSGPCDSSVAMWIQQHGLGWNLREGSLDSTAIQLVALKNDPQSMATLNQHCFKSYHDLFSKATIIDRLESALKSLLASD